jgi:hypothetical protein
MDRSSALLRLVTQVGPAEIGRMAAAVGQWLGALAPDKHSPGQQRHLEPAVSGSSNPGAWLRPHLQKSLQAATTTNLIDSTGPKRGDCRCPRPPRSHLSSCTS